MQFHAGFVLESVRDVARRRGLEERLRPLATFELDVDREPTPVDDGWLAVVDNLLSRGLPTLASPRVERALAGAVGWTTEDDDPVALRFPVDPSVGGPEKDLLARALSVVDTRVEGRLPDARPPLESEAERAFFDRALPEIVGPWVRQVVELQRPVTTILPSEADEYVDQRVDFSAQLYAEGERPSGLVLEVDGEQHHTGVQLNLDNKRVRAMEKAGWPTVRVAARNAARPQAPEAEAIRAFFEGPAGDELAQNWRVPLWESPAGRRALQVALVPLAVARVQKTVVHLVRDGHLDPEASVWRLAVVERDVPAARLAVDDLSDLLGRLADLEGQGRRVPAVELRVYRTAEFEGCEVGAGDDAERYDEEGRGVLDFAADAVIDLSVLQRAGFSRLGDAFLERVGPGATVATIRSSHSVREAPRVAAGVPVEWAGVEGEAGVGALEYLLQAVFRKRAYRPKQVDVMRPALRGGSVAGILPTGAGKSICYQLPALLQPGMTFVVAPLKSLMKDQHDNLVRAGIDRTAFVNSTLRAKERKRVQAEVRQGAYQFVFVSPERFLIQEFRDEVKDLEVPLAYCVVDEAHCVSEWGHDFRTAYLRLGRNARAHCRTAWPARDGRPVLPIVALTGTASFDVLADVRRELEFGPAVPDVLPESFERTELAFEIVPVPRPEGLDGKTHDFWAVRDAVIAQKVEALGDVLGRLPADLGAGGDGAADPEAFFALDGRRTRSGLVFTPHANGAYGVQALRRALEQEAPPLKGAVGTYASSDETTDDSELEATQSKFKDNELGALVATKAFGMGIDKPNIRYVVHVNFSQSIESYYQEAGRAGRDRQPARCVVLYCDQPIEKGDGSAPSVDLDLMLFFHGGSFKGPERDRGILESLLAGDARPVEDPEDGSPLKTWPRVSPSIDAMLDAMAEGDVHTVVFPFENHVKDEVAAYLKAKVHPKINPGLLTKPWKDLGRAEGEEEVDGFIRALEEQLAKANVQPEPDFEPHRDWLAEALLRRRDEKDTQKAIYRLTTVGLVDDYIVDYNANVVLAWVRKRPDGEYAQALFDYLARYVAPERVNALREQARLDRWSLRDCLDHLVEFVYATIAAKRREAIDQMEEAVREGATRGSRAFQDRVNTYFDSRYTEDLRGRLGDGLAHYDLALVWDFIDRTEGVADNVKHLRGACDRLLVSAPDNGALLLLRAFTRVLEHGDGDAFAADFAKGWRPFADEKGLSRREVMAGHSHFYRRVAAYDATAAPQVGAFIAREHARWLRSFNDRFTRSPSDG